MAMVRIEDFRTFWPFYLGEHASRLNRRLHFVGTNLALAAVGAGIFIHPVCFVFAPFAGYGFAWIGHFVVEKNRPATFQYPLWSLLADFKMWALFWTGRLDRELERHVVGSTADAAG